MFCWISLFVSASGGENLRIIVLARLMLDYYCLSIHLTITLAIYDGFKMAYEKEI